MINVRKLAAMTLIAATVAGGLGTAAKASTKWTDGLYDGHNGYYMAYGYYYDSDSRHYSWAKLGNTSTGNKYAPAGQTSQANTPSLQETSWDAGYGY